MAWTDIFKTPQASVLHGTFGVPSREAIKAQQQVTLATYQGPGREKVLAWLEKRGAVPNGVADAARGGSSPIEIGQAVHSAWQTQLAGGGGVVEGGAQAAGRRAAQAGAQMVGDTVEAGAYAAARGGSANPVYGGLIGQMMQGRGFQGYAVPGSQIAGAAQQVAGLVETAAPVAANASASASAGVAGAAAAAGDDPEVRNFVDNALTYIGTAENRSAVLRDTIDSMAAAGHSDGIDAILAREIVAAPAEHSAPALLAALERSADPIVAAAEHAPAAAEAVAGAMHVAPEAVHAVAEAAQHAGPGALKVAAEVHPETLAAFSDSLKAALKLVRF